jgi:hypothetical protein
MDVSGQESSELPAFVQLCLSGKVVEEFELCAPVVSVGRSEECDIVIDHSAVAGFHALLSQKGDKLLIEDAAATVGIPDAGTRKPVELGPGESVNIGGKYSMRLVQAPAGEARQISGSGFYLDNVEQTDLVVDRNSLASISHSVRPAYLTLDADDRDTWIVRLDSPCVSIGGGRSADIRIGGWFTPASIAVVEWRDDGYYMVVEPGREMEVDGRRIVDETRLSEGTRFRVRELTGVFHEPLGIPH